MNNEKIKKHKRRFRIYNICCVIISILVTYGIYWFCLGWAKGDGNEVNFTSSSFFILLGLFVGFYISAILPGYLLHKILMWKDK